MADDGTIACSEELWLSDSAGILTKLTCLVSVGLPSFTVAEVDITSQKDNCVMNRRAGLTDLNTFTFTLLHEPRNADDTLIREHIASKATRPAKIVYGDADDRTDVTFDVFIVEYNPGDETAPGELRSSTGTLRPTITPTYAAV